MCLNVALNKERKPLPTAGGVTFVQKSIFYKKFPSEILHKKAWIELIE